MKMFKQMGQPQNGMPFIHVAGTNGKGSVCAFLTSVFREAGLKVGTFISPHLIDFEERIMVDGRQISREDVTRIGNVLLEQEFGVTPTMFDYCVLMAVLYFKEQNCDLVIMETGLGGRLDSTNALGNPVVSVITRIGYDHMNILGNTIEEIAQEKAGIIKAGVPVVIAPQESEALAVLQRAAAAHGLAVADGRQAGAQAVQFFGRGHLAALQIARAHGQRLCREVLHRQIHQGAAQFRRRGIAQQLHSGLAVQQGRFALVAGGQRRSRNTGEQGSRQTDCTRAGTFQERAAGQRL